MIIDQDIKNLLKIEGIAVLVIILLFTVFDFIPKFKEGNQLGKKITDLKKKEESESLEDQNEKLKIEEESGRIEENLWLFPRITSVVKGKTLNKESMPLVTMEIEDLFEASNLKIDSIRPEEGLIKDEYEIVPFIVQFRCDYKQLMSLLEKLADSSKLVSVGKLIVNKDELNYPNLNVRLSVNALFALESKEKENEVVSGDEVK